ncbi:hypothetical protein [Streptomyces longisporoflavus]|uniref:Uncharacterized protein n=1 Tax=Streptomyces longisporoflavus TaxID=28044 RepID=A0ABW7R5W3_9ACTN
MVDNAVQNVVTAAKDAPETVQKLTSSNDPKEAKLGNALSDLVDKLPIGGTGFSGNPLG